MSAFVQFEKVANYLTSRIKLAQNSESVMYESNQENQMFFSHPLKNFKFGYACPSTLPESLLDGVLKC